MLLLPNSRHTHPISTQKVPRRKGTAVQEPCRGLPLLTFPHKSPPAPKHVPQKHNARPRASFLCPHSGRTQRVSQKPPCVNPVPRRIMTTSKRQPCAPARRPVDTARAGHARVHTGPGPAPWRRAASLTTGADRAGACGTASAWGPRVGEATSGREDPPLWVSHIGLYFPCPHSRPRGALSAPPPRPSPRAAPAWAPTFRVAGEGRSVTTGDLLPPPI